jgi:hypothetical protein
MNQDTVRKLARAEYDFAALDGRLADLRDLLRQCARESPVCAAAAGRVRVLRRALRQVLYALDKDITDAVRALEALDGPPPF